MKGSDLFIEEIASRVVEKLRGAGAMNHSGRRWPEVMDVDTAAEYIDRTPEAIRNLVRKKIVPVTRLDGRVQIRRCDMDRVIERHTV